MMEVQLIADHNAAMECYRLASRASEADPSEQALPHLCDAPRSPKPPPRQGPAEGDDGARSRPFRRAGSYGRRGGFGWRGSRRAGRSTLCKANRPWRAHEERASVPIAGDAEWPMAACMADHQPGAPNGNRNAFRHGRYTAEAIASRLEVGALIRAMRALACASEESN